MKQKRPLRLSVLTWIHILLLFWSVYPFLADMLSYEDKEFWGMVASGLILLIPIAGSWALVPRVKHFQLYLLLGIAISIAVGGLASFEQPATAIGVPVTGLLTGLLSALLFLARAISKRNYGLVKEEYMALHHEEAFPLHERDMLNFLNQPHPGHLAIPTILYGLAILMNNRTCLPVIFAMVAADVVVLALYAHGDNFYEYMRQKQGTANMPVGTMRRIHRFTGLLGLCILLLMMLPAILYGKEVVVDANDSGWFELEPIADSTLNERRSAVSQDDLLMESVGDMETVQIPGWISDLMQLFAYAIFAALVIYAIIKILIEIWHFKHNFEAEEEDEVIDLDEDSEGIITRVLRRTKTEGSMTPNRVIRRRYRKAIRRSLKGAPKEWGTPTEIEHEAALDRDEAMQNLHGYYEKARYSKDGCTQEDVQNCT